MKVEMAAEVVRKVVVQMEMEGDGHEGESKNGRRHGEGMIAQKWKKRRKLRKKRRHRQRWVEKEVWTKMPWKIGDRDTDESNDRKVGSAKNKDKEI